MRGRRTGGYAVWLLLTACLYFFENNTGTRILLVCSLLLPLVPTLRRALMAPDAEKAAPRFREQSMPTAAKSEPEDAGSLRLYQPGDPLNRVHWKLSAGRDTLLVRELAEGQEKGTPEQRSFPGELPSRSRSNRGPVFIICQALFAAALILLLLLPEARLGAMALANRIFRASEAVNAYVYHPFPVPAHQSVLLACVLLSVLLLSWLVLTVLSRRSVPLLLTMTGCVLFQVYFGLSFPLWLQILLFLFFLCVLLQRPWQKKALLLMLGCVAVIGLAISLLWPRPDAATEAASEAVRDQLSRTVQEITGRTAELPSGSSEVRHTHTQSLSAGEGIARPEREFQLITREEEQFSMPHWVNYLKIAGLLLLTVAVIVLPFLPFVLLQAREKKALAARAVFQSADISAAVCAILQHTVAWLDAMACGGENLPFRLWPPALIRHGLPEAYAKHFGACALLYEEAAYSEHTLSEEQRQEALALLEETEALLKARAGLRQRLRLKYKEFLWI